MQAERLQDEQALAHESAAALSRSLQALPECDRARITLDNESLILPRHALDLLRDILSEMAQGNAVAVMPKKAELTTQVAADMLGVSRPYLIKLLEQGALPFHKVGKHRRIYLTDLQAYQATQQARQESALDELTRQAQELDMGY